MDLTTVDKFYNIHEDAMSEAQWAALYALYAELPGFLGYSDPDGHPGWFNRAPAVVGKESGYEQPYLWVSVEASGLQVGGQLSPEDWATWDSAFIAIASQKLGFPVAEADGRRPLPTGREPR
ncbi:hypothetical protein [Longimicrobium sp.]|uniref:hypothetical protein n=1 Tax=Longimicrobium sp. TaxID=2029185 RepID=UPI003B3A16BD